MSAPKLSFYDHHRMSYGHLPLREDYVKAEFLIGDYGDEPYDDGVGKGGEFKITLVELGARGGRPPLFPHLEVFGEARGSLEAAIAKGLLAELGPVMDRNEFSTRLLSIGIPDRSEVPLEGYCPHCGSPLPDRVRV